MSKQQSLFGPDANYCYDEDDDITTKMAKFIIERHKIYLKKSFLKKPKPWTTDPILANFRFCNIYRELDTVSEWIIENVIKPYRDNENLWFMLAMSRVINWPDTLQEIMDEGAWPEDKFDPDAVFKILEGRKRRGDKVITGAYLINSVYPAGHAHQSKGKTYFIPHLALHPMWCDRKKIGPVFKTTMKNSAQTLQLYRGWASFMSYQVVVDLSYDKRWLKNASDYNTFNSPGPGTVRGLNRYFTGSRKGTIPKKDLNAKIIQQREEVNERLRELVPDKWWTDDFKTGFAEISMSNMSNSNCEFDKHQRVVLGEGEMRATYAGTDKKMKGLF